eukprot:836555-Rhodomonas_salina.1
MSKALVATACKAFSAPDCLSFRWQGTALTWPKTGRGEGSVDGNSEDGRGWPLRQLEFPKKKLRTATYLQFSTIH